MLATCLDAIQQVYFKDFLDYTTLPLPPFRSRPLKSNQRLWGSAVSSPKLDFGAF